MRREPVGVLFMCALGITPGASRIRFCVSEPAMGVSDSHT